MKIRGPVSALVDTARFVMLGLMKTCRKHDLSFFADLGARLASLVAPLPAA